FCLSATFFCVGGYMFEQALEIWFQHTYLSGWDLGLILGLFLFWNTMYLLRFGLFVLFAGVCSAAAIYPFRVAAALLACLCVGVQLFNDSLSLYFHEERSIVAALAIIGLILITFETEIMGWWNHRVSRRESRADRKDETVEEFENIEAVPKGV